MTDEPPETIAPPPVKKKRSRPRRIRPRKKTVALKRITRELKLGWLNLGITDDEQRELFTDRPKTRDECRLLGTNVERPCPWVGCEHHLYLDVNPDTGSITLNFPDLEPSDVSYQI